ncbi:hypothetical protein GQ464_007455 [Rhodocaloribacter litoris]|uniref:c-type cytochrome n=1 Tax=Rhodocaloribacter litoris TaxID=2558931 RepID=UPI0014217FE2|nr:hypothetical protein [Rhodocaloribacter litoris]QXD16765.1 hypothetical protein GQ464_007455 [Rhodocaloribacter litoris]
MKESKHATFGHDPVTRLTLVIVMAVFGIGCEHADPREEEPPPPDDTVSFAAVQSIFTSNCAFSGCHAGTFPAQGLNLSAGQAYANIVNVPSQEEPSLDRVEPGDPDRSYLFMKITGAPGIRGERMPLGRPPLSAEQIERIRRWIEAGAPND